MPFWGIESGISGFQCSKNATTIDKIISQVSDGKAVDKVDGHGRWHGGCRGGRSGLRTPAKRTD